MGWVGGVGGRVGGWVGVGGGGWVAGWVCFDLVMLTTMSSHLSQMQCKKKRFHLQYTTLVFSKVLTVVFSQELDPLSGQSLEIT